jgi:hypothetical protein
MQRLQVSRVFVEMNKLMKMLTSFKEIIVV